MNLDKFRTPTLVLVCGSLILCLGFGIRSGFGLFLQLLIPLKCCGSRLVKLFYHFRPFVHLGLLEVNFFQIRFARERGGRLFVLLNCRLFLSFRHSHVLLILANSSLHLHRFVDLSHAKVLSLLLFVPNRVLLLELFLTLGYLFGCALFSHFLTQLSHLI